MPLLPHRMQPEDTQDMSIGEQPSEAADEPLQSRRAQHIKVKNRRKTYLDKNPDYFNPSLELADPLLYDRLIRRFQTTSEREAEGRQKGYSGVLEADLRRSEAKLAALASPDSSSVSYRRDSNGEIRAEDARDAPANKEDGQDRWKREMTERFLRGEDDDFDYGEVDNNEAWDDKVQEARDDEEKWFSEEPARWILDDETAGVGKQVTGETGIQDF